MPCCLLFSYPSFHGTEATVAWLVRPRELVASLVLCNLIGSFAFCHVSLVTVDSTVDSKLILSSVIRQVAKQSHFCSLFVQHTPVVRTSTCTHVLLFLLFWFSYSLTYIILLSCHHSILQIHNGLPELPKLFTLQRLGEIVRNHVVGRTKLDAQFAVCNPIR